MKETNHMRGKKMKIRNSKRAGTAAGIRKVGSGGSKGERRKEPG